MPVWLRRPRLILVPVGVAAVLALPGLGRLRVDNSPEVYFAADEDRLAGYRDYHELFGGGRTVRLSWSGPAIWSPPGLAWLAAAEARAASLPGVRRATGLAGHHRWLEPDWPPAEPERLREATLADELDRGSGWISADGSTASVIVELEPSTLAAERRLLAQLRSLAGSGPPGLEAVVTGLPVLQESLDASLRTVAWRILPLLTLLATGLLAAAFRNPGDVLVPLLFVGLLELLVWGSIGWLGGSLNSINVLLLPLLFVTALATAVHLQIRHRRTARAADAAAAAAETVRAKRWPILWAGLTTGAAFGSFGLSQLPPVRSLGVWTALAVTLLTTAALTLYPAALAASRWRSAGSGGRFDRFAERVGAATASLARRRPAVVAGGAAALTLTLAAGLSRLAVDTGLLTYFRGGHPVRAALTRLHELGVGAASAELILRFDEDAADSFRDPAQLDRLAALSRRLGAQSPALGAISAGELLRSATEQMVDSGTPTERLRWLVLGMLQSEPAASGLLDSLVTRNGRAARVSLLLPLAGYQELLPALRALAVEARRDFPGARVGWTGEYPLILLAQEKLLGTMALSLALTFLCVIVIFAALLRSLRAFTAVVAINLWPALLTLGAMGWTGVPIDSTTVMIAAVALGLSVDDTFHTLAELHRRGSEADPVPAAVSRVAPAQLLTTAVLAVGLLTCGLSDFVPVARFGLLTAAAVAAALAGDWLLLPALLPRSAQSAPSPKTEP